MKSSKLLFPSIILSLVLLSLSFTSCQDKCAGVDCGANGNCVEGVCQCDPGYEGTNCEKTWAAKYVGTWSASDNITHTTVPTTTLGPYNYNSTISVVNPQSIIINSVSGVDAVECTLNTPTSFTISYTTSWGNQWSGGGSISGGGSTGYTINIYYIVNYSGGGYDVGNGTWVPN